ncbi:DUF4823 domain-containing protein [Celerinatantimonas yamalensis]|uniref:DUF4823 domain-containing protein n=1 Tax=Celerinatantimonas yamalensis TaxID=559956 RepID=A0ABW9G9P7_9GAMM
MYTNIRFIIILAGLIGFSVHAQSLFPNKAVLISKVRQPINGPSQNQAETDQASLALVMAFKQYTTERVTYDAVCNSVDCLAGPKSHGYDYYVSPQWVYWDNSAQTPNSQPDIKIAVYSVKTRQVIASRIISANKSSALIGAPTPILSEQIKQAITSLYQDK